jgi:hypothetical protein
LIKLQRAFLIIIVIMHLSAVELYAFTVSTNPMQKLVDKVNAYFTPQEMIIKNVLDENVQIEPSINAVLLKGMRLDVLRQGDMFYHPVTNEEIGRLEKNIGMIEVIGVEKNIASAKVLSGKVKSSDKVRITSSKIKALYYQQGSLDWYVGDACYRELLNSERFELIDTKNRDGNIEKLIAEAKEKGAQVLIYADDVSDVMRPVLRLRMFWSSDGKEITSEIATLNYEYLQSINPKRTLLNASKGVPIITYELLSDSKLVTVGNFTLNNKKEMVVVSDSSLVLYQLTTELSKIIEYRLPDGAEPLYVGSFDINKNGVDEVILTTKNNNIIHSYIYEIEEGRFVIKWETDGFLKVMQNRLLYQGCNPESSDGNSIHYVTWDGKYAIGEIYLKIVQNSVLKDYIILYNLIGFNISDDEVLTLQSDSTNHLTLIDKDRKNLWKSDEIFTNSLNKFSTNCNNKSLAQWNINDKLMILNKNILAVKRKPDNSIVMLWWDGKTINQNVLINEINGELIDYVVSDGWIYVLTRASFGKKTGNFFKGKDPFTTYVQVYSINY